MKNHYIFPAIFEPNGIGGYGISFPDLPGCISVGDDFEHATAMSKEALGLHLWNFEDDNMAIPEPGRPELVEMSDFEHGSFVVPVEVYMQPLRDRMANKVIKKTLTLPSWLNKAAEEHHLNFSQLLAAAIKQELGILER